MSMLARFMRDALFAPKGQEVCAKSVKGGQTGREQSAQKKDDKDATIFGGAQRDSQNLIFAPKARQGRETGQGQSAAQERPMSRRQDVSQAAEPTHVDHVPHRVHDASRGQEQQGLEKSVRE